jgi:ABC-2 type transport system ATP-binding protein
MSLLKAQTVNKTFEVQKRTGFWKRENKNVRALTDFTLSIDEPMIIGLIGPNGAGKTTFIKHCLGLVEKTSGSLEVLGFDPYTGEPLSDENKKLYPNQNNWLGKLNRFLGGSYNKAPFLKQVGLVSGQKQNLDPNLSALDSLRLSGYLYDMLTDDIEERINYLVDKFAIREKLDVPVRQLSLGQRMKFEIISSVLHSPKFLFMDEPSLGLDFEAQGMMREMLLELHNTQGLTILLTSHYLPDITTLCSRVAVIEKGQKVFDGGVQELMQKADQDGYLKTLIVELNKQDKVGEIA